MSYCPECNAFIRVLYSFVIISSRKRELITLALIFPLAVVWMSVFVCVLSLFLSVPCHRLCHILAKITCFSKHGGFWYFDGLVEHTQMHKHTAAFCSHTQSTSVDEDFPHCIGQHACLSKDFVYIRFVPLISHNLIPKPGFFTNYQIVLNLLIVFFPFFRVGSQTKRKKV